MVCTAAAISKTTTTPAAARPTVIKAVVAEPRPCYAYPRDFLLEHCPPVSDYAFPSNHSMVAAAMAAALFLISWRLGVLAVLATALIGFSRVYVGAHYPHDVIAGLLVGAVMGLFTTVALRRYATSLVEKLRDTRLRPLLSAPRPTVASNR